MKIAKVQISNILGIKRLEFKPGKITTITGQNGSGKTSILEAIKGVVGGGHDATLLRKGAEEGMVVLEFDNGETLIKKMNENKSKVILEDPNGREVSRAATYIKEIIDPIGLNPVQILTADSKKRVNMLLDSVPMELPVEEIKMITGLQTEEDGRHPLKIIDEKRKMIFDDRAAVNKEVEKLNTMIDEMNKTIPFKPDENDWATEADKLRGELQKKKEENETQKAARTKLHNSDIAKAKEAAQKEIDEIREALQSRLDSLREQYGEAINEITSANGPDIEGLIEKLTQAENNAKIQTKISGAVEFVEKNRKEVELQEGQSKSFTEQLKSLDNLKAELLANLPVDGLEIKDGDILINGVPFDTLNEAAKIRFALKIAGLRKAKLPLVCVDGLEALDKSVFEAFKEEAEKTDMQFFVTRVSEDRELTVA